MKLIKSVANSRELTSIVRRMCQSIQIDYALLIKTHDIEHLRQTLADITKSKGYGEPRGNSSWVARLASWGNSKDVKFICFNESTNAIYLVDYLKHAKQFQHILPIFHSYGDITKAVNTEKLVQETKQEKPKMKSLFENVLETNKSSAVLAAKLTAGKTANDFIESKLQSSLPWYAKFFNRGKKTPFAKLVTANIAVALAQHFGNSDARLKFISEAMLEDAMVSMTRDSEMLENFISELTNKVSIPSSVLDNFNKEQGN